MQFRKDINGLRAIAVLPVIFFHAGLNGFDGGFLGVDVFFVISGFLITSNIIKKQSEGNFSLLDFYDKRARRILPPLIFTILATTLLSFYFMLPYDLKNFGQSIIATSFAANNILLYMTSGYWSLAAEYKPLYHTWSLGIEEQYYFIIPLIFIIFFRKQKVQISIIVTLFLISFISSYLTDNKEFNFLIIATRFWELCAGSLLAMYMAEKKIVKNDIFSLLGLFLIFLSYYNPHYLSKNQAIINIMPILGVLLIIAFTSQKGFIYRALSQKPIAIIGLTSYSIYLFHQPLLSFLRLASESEVSTHKQLTLSLISIPLGYLSWKLIESPFRQKNIIPNVKFYTLLAFFIASFVFTGLFLHKTYGMQNYEVFSKYSYGINPQAYADRAYSLTKSTFSSTDKKMLIIGNSFARDFYNALQENGATNGYEVIYLFDYNIDKKLSRKLLESADLTIWVSSSGMANIEINNNILKSSALEIKNELEKHSNGNYYFIGTKNYGLNNNFIKQLDWESTNNHMVEINKSNISAEKIESNIFSEKYISLLNLFREGDKTRIFTDKHRFISFDTSHITKDGAIYLGHRVLTTTNLKKIIL